MKNAFAHFVRPRNKSRGHPSPKAFQKAFTLAEVMVTTALVVILGGVAFVVFNTGLTLFTKTMSITSAEEDARSLVQKVRLELSRAMESPVLLNQARAAVPAPFAGGLGIRFRVAPMDGAGNMTVVSLADQEAGIGFTTVAFMVENGQQLVFYPNFISAATPGQGRRLSNSLVAPLNVVAGGNAADYPFNYSSFGRGSVMLDLNFKVLARSFTERFRRNAVGQDIQNQNTFFQLRSLVWLKSGNLLN